MLLPREAAIFQPKISPAYQSPRGVVIVEERNAKRLDLLCGRPHVCLIGRQKRQSDLFGGERNQQGLAVVRTYDDSSNASCYESAAAATGDFGSEESSTFGKTALYPRTDLLTISILLQQVGCFQHLLDHQGRHVGP